MTKRNVERLRDAMPDGIEMEPLEALLPEILAAAQSGREEPSEVATLFLDAIERAAENRRRFQPGIEQAFLGWVKTHWAIHPAAYFDKLCAILVNLETDSARVFLEEQRAAATDAEIESRLAFSLRNRTPANPLA